MIALALLLGLAGAQEAPPEPPADPPADVPAAPASDEEGEAPLEVIVWGRLQVEAARDEVIALARSEGYVRERRRDGYTILRHDDPWKGDLRLYDDGRVELRRQPLRFEPPFPTKSPAAWLSCILLPLCIRPSGQLISPRKFHAQERTIRAAIQPEVVAWNDRIADWALDEKLDAIPERLEDLWTDGVALDGGEPIVSWDQRKLAILTFWDTRTDTAWGLAVRGAIESFVRAVVQESEHPITPAELDAFNQARSSLQPFPALSAP